MAPSTRCVVLASLALLACVLTLSATNTQAAVMGIDFGSEFIKVASVKPGTPFHIVVDEQSKRKIPAVVSFDNGERHFGNGAVQLAMRKPKETYLWAHRLLGKDINAPQVKELKEQGFPWEIVSTERGTLAFRHSAAKSGEDKDVVFTVEEIVAMSLQHIMKIAETDAESPVKDCVLTVPPYWSHRERQAMLDAAEIAGLNVLSLVNENAAAAIQYGIDRKYALNETHTVLFYNMGSTSTKVNLAHYSGWVKKERARGGNKTVGQFETRAMGYDDTLGGHAFEMRIVDWVAKEVNAQLAAKKKGAAAATPYDIRTNPKAMAKIRSAAEKAKVVLSANQESQVFLNSLHDDMDFKMMLTRDAFLGLCSDLMARVTAPIQSVLDDSGVTLEQIDSVVIIGGGVRIPAIQAAIKAFVGKEHLTQSLNGDEAMVMGAVFRAANLSTTFQVRPFGMVDTTSYAVGVRITDGAAATETANAAAAAADETPEDSTDDATPSSSAAASTGSFSKRASLFKRHNRLMKKKTVQFSHTADFVAQLAHEASKSNPLPRGIPLPIDLYNVTGLARLMNQTRYAEMLATQKPRVALSFLLDSSGLSTLVKADATLEEMVKVLKPKKVVKDNSTAETNSTSTDKTDAEAEKKEGEEAEKKDGEDAAPKTDAEADSAEKKEDGESETAAADADKSAEGDKSASEPEFTMKKKTHTIPLWVSKVGSPGSIEAMNATHKVMAKATLEKLRRADDLKKEIAASKNTLEAHIYATRASLSEADVETVSSEEQREAVRVALAAAEEWLYEQGDDSATVFQDKLAELRALSDPIFFRLGEATALPQAINTTQTLIDFVRKQVIDYAKNRPWVPEVDRFKLKEKVDDLAEWLAEKQAAQKKVSPIEPPVLESEALYERLRPIHKLSNDMMKLKKPAEKPKSKKNDKDSEKAKKGKKSSKADAAAEDKEAAAQSDKSEDEPLNADKEATTEGADTQANAEGADTTDATANADAPAASDAASAETDEPVKPTKDEL